MASIIFTLSRQQPALWTTPTDLCRFISDIQRAMTGKPGTLLSKESMLRMVAPGDGNAGLGVFISEQGGKKYFQHSGGNEGFSCIYIGCFENGDGLTVMTNNSNGSIISEMVNSIAIAYGWKDYYRPAVKTVVFPPQDILDRYTGRYKTGEDTIFINRKDGSLYLYYMDQPSKMYFTSDTKFFICEFQGDFEFVVNAQGKIKSINQNGQLAAVRVEQ